jgi:hypothetical protein
MGELVAAPSQATKRSRRMRQWSVHWLLLSLRLRLPPPLALVLLLLLWRQQQRILDPPSGRIYMRRLLCDEEWRAQREHLLASVSARLPTDGYGWVGESTL